MNSQNVGSAIPAEKVQFETQTARDVDGVIPTATAEEMGLDDLVNYQPVPPRTVTRIVVRYERAGRGSPLPYFIDEVRRGMTIEPFWGQISEPDLRQGDLLPRCLVPVAAADFANENGPGEGTAIEYDLIVLTQSCDLEQRKVRLVATCPIFPLAEFEAVNPAFRAKRALERGPEGPN